MLKKIIKKTFLYKPLKSIIKKYRKYKKDKHHKIEEKKVYLENLFTYEKAEKEISERYYKKFNEELDWNNPQTFCEKMNFTKLYNPTKKKALLTDKITVRDWIEKKLGKEYLIPLIATYDTFEEIDFKKLPKEYVVKCNHDSGSTRIIDKSHPLNKKELQKDYHYYLNRNLANFNYEMHYRDIEPKIIIEEKLGDDIKDYKFFCFNGEIKFFKIDFDRFANHKANYYDPKGNLLHYGERLFPPDYKAKVPMPKQLHQMFKIAKKLSKGFDFVRVDLYEKDNKVYFGEMTFTAGNGMSPFTDRESELLVGSYWKLNTKKRKRLLHKELVLKNKKNT